MSPLVVGLEANLTHLEVGGLSYSRRAQSKRLQVQTCTFAAMRARIAAHVLRARVPYSYLPLHEWGRSLLAPDTFHTHARNQFYWPRPCTPFVAPQQPCAGRRHIRIVSPAIVLLGLRLF